MKSLTKLEVLLVEEELYSPTTYIRHAIRFWQRWNGTRDQELLLASGRSVAVVGKKMKKSQVHTGIKGKNIKTKMYI